MNDNKDINSYKVRVLVAGSRFYTNYQEFETIIEHRINLLLRNIPREDICFISGKASHGPDDMIIHWCERNNYRCFEYPADWNELGKIAGFVRNKTMSKICTHAIIVWDGISSGTKHMLGLVRAKGCQVALHYVKRSKCRDKQYREATYGWQSKKSSRSPLVHD